MKTKNRLSSCLLAVIVVLVGIQALGTDAGSKPAAKSIVPLQGKIEFDRAPELENLNQCAGTVQHYLFPPVGYSPPPESPQSKQGKQLYLQLNCASCHAIEDNGGTLGPPLDGIGGHRGREFIIARLLDPEAQMRDFPEVFGGRPNIMPHPHISREQAELLAAYLLSLPEPAGGFLITTHGQVVHSPAKPDQISWLQFKKNPDAIRAGQEIFGKRGCAACHETAGTGGYLAPALDGISSRKTAQEVMDLLTDQATEPDMCLSIALLTNQERLDIMEFLAALNQAKKPTPYQGKPVSLPAKAK